MREIRRKFILFALIINLIFMGIRCGGGGMDSNVSGQVPSAPKGLIAKPGNEEVLIKWSEVSNANSYNIYYLTTPKVTKDTGKKILNVKSPFSHVRLKNGITYYYIVTAVNDYGESPESEIVSAMPLESITNKYVGAMVCDYLAKRIWDIWKRFDPLPTLRKNGFGWARVWVRTINNHDLRNTPVSQWNDLPWKEEYWSSLEYAEQILKEASQEGMRLNLVFFLSDKPAASFYQPVPSDWEGLSVDESATALEDYCYKTIKYLRDKGLNIEIYEVGNEIEYGILDFLPGHRINLDPSIDITTDMEWMRNNIWNIEATLLKGAIRGIKKADPGAKITLHINTVGLRPENYIVKSFFKTMIDYGVEFDFAGLSFPYFNYYPVPQPFFNSSQLRQIIDYISFLGKKVIVSEFSYPNNPNGITGTPDPAYPFTLEGQAKWIKDFLSLRMMTILSVFSILTLTIFLG